MKRLMTVMFALIICLGMALYTIPAASADTFPEDGKIIRFIVPNPPGGGMDLYPRTLAPFIAKHLPWKNGDVVVENVVGAGGLRGSRETFTSKPDGYTIGIVMNQIVTLPPLLGQVAYFDAARYTFFGQFNNFPAIVFTGSKNRLQSFADLKNSKEPVTYGMDMQQLANFWVMKEKMGLNIKPILGFQGSPDIRLAVLKGEVDLGTAEYSSFAHHYKSGELRMLLNFGKEPDKRCPEVPTMLELGYPEEYAGVLTVARTIVGPPDIPEDRTKILQKAIWAALNDPEFIAACSKSERLQPDVKNAEQTRESVLHTANFWKKYKDEIKKEMEAFGYR